MTGGVTISTIENVEIQADAADYDESTGEISLHGTVLLRQQLRSANRRNDAARQRQDDQVA